MSKTSKGVEDDEARLAQEIPAFSGTTYSECYSGVPQTPAPELDNWTRSAQRDAVNVHSKILSSHWVIGTRVDLRTDGAAQDDNREHRD